MEYPMENWVLGKLDEIASGDVAGLLNVDAGVKSLKQTVLLVQSFLRDADQKPRYEQSHSLQEWIRQIRDLVFEMEDLVDEYAIFLCRCASAVGGWKSRLRRFAGAKFLRVLDLQKLHIEQLPKEIGDLILLRYLNLTGSKLKELPSSIGNLINLQTFYIHETKIQDLPDAFWKIRTLRHVFLNNENMSMPKATYCSEDIQSLVNISSGPWVRDGALEKLRNLRCLHLNNMSSSDEDALANAVQNLSRLDNLTLFAESLPVSVLTSTCYHRIQILFLHGPLVRPARIHMVEGNSMIFSNLIHLVIWETRLEKDEDIAILASLANLQNLQLFEDAFVGRVLVFPKGGFPRLQEILLWDLSKLEQWEVGEGAMPLLRHLRLWFCRNLRLLPEGLVRLTELKEIIISGMEMIERRVDKDTGEDYHKIKHVPCIEIN